MTRKHIIIAMLCAISMLTVLVGLYAISPLTKGVYRGAFERKFISNNILSDQKFMELPYNSYYIAGTSKDNVYLANYTNPFHLIQINLEKLDSQYIKIKVIDPKVYEKPEAIKVKVDSPYFFLLHGTLPGIFRGRLESPTADHIKNDDSFFVDAEPISKSSFAIRFYSKRNKSTEIAKKIEGLSPIQYQYDAIKKQADGIFCTQGMLTKNNEENEIIYVYSLRNEYIVMDTNLNIKYKSHTLDTFSRAQVKFAQIDDETAMTTGLPTTINTHASASKSLLLIRSNVLSKNEDLKNFVDGSTIDIFSLKNNQYRGSINLGNFQGKHLTDLRISKDKLITLHGEYIVIQSVNTDSTNN